MSFSDCIDIHTHILPGVDDGPKNLEESAALARCYTDMGITQIIATSHFIPGTAWASSRQCIIEKIAELQEFFKANGIPLTVFPGMEIAYHARLLEKLEKGSLLPLANSSWYLIEPSFTDSGDALLCTLDQLLDQGWKIILAHPERIPAFQEMETSFTQLVRQGLRLQVNSGSLLGRFGEKCRRTGLHFIDQGWVHYLASDAHGVDSRRPPTAEQWLELETLIGTDQLTQLCCSNPAQLLTENACQ